MAGEYTRRGPTRTGLRAFLSRLRCGSLPRGGRAGEVPVPLERTALALVANRADAAAGALHRLPGAADLRRDEARCSARWDRIHISADIGCHSVRDLAAVQYGQHDHGLWPGRRRRRGSQRDRAASARSR